MARPPVYALTLKQPWAALVAGGLKSVQIRRWATTVRGRVYIHAARGPDDRPEAWAQVPDDLRHMTNLSGHVIGVADLAACLIYRTPAAFAADAARHRNAPDWFRPPHMYGFEFRNPTLISPFPCKGRVRFFKIELPEPV